MSLPVISVVMAAYNSESYIVRAIESILNQSYPNIEFIIVNDASTDSTSVIIDEYAKKYPRIVKLENIKNLGLASSLNKGFSYSSGKYIARMDCDDVSLKERLRKQFDFMEGNDDVSVCGTGAIVFGENNYETSHLLDSDDLSSALLFYNPIFHPSVMFRASCIGALENIYEDGRRRVEDLELWHRMAPNYKIVNLKENLICYRTYSPESVSKRKSVVAHGNVIRKARLEDLVGLVTDDEFMLHMKIARCKRNDSLLFFQDSAVWLSNIILKNSQKKLYDTASLSRIVSMYWWSICVSSSELGLKAYRFYFSKPELTKYNPGIVKTGVFLMKCLFKVKPKHPSIHSDELQFVGYFPDS